MKRAIGLSGLVLALAGCATGGSSGSTGTLNSGGNGVTLFSSPKSMSKEEFAKAPKAYANDWVAYKGGGVDSFKKVTIPSYTLEFQTGMYTVGSNKLAGMFANADGARSALTMGVSFPWEKHEAILKDVAATSYGRLKEKFKKTGVEVVEWSNVMASNEKAAAFNQERLAMTPVVTTENSVSIAAPGVARLQSGMWAYAASSLSRDAEIALIFPNFGVGFGYFGGESTPYTITESHGMAGVTFTPQTQIYTGSGFAYQSKWHTGNIGLDRTVIANEPFVVKMVKGDDTRAEAKGREQMKRAFAMVTTGSLATDVKTSSSAGVNYVLDIDAKKYKAILLEQLDAAENLLIERYKNEL